LDIVSLSLATKMLAMLLMSALSVSVKTNSGEKIEGDLVGFTADVVQIDAAGLTREFPFDELMSLTPTSSKAGTGPTFRVTLVGGSRIAAQDLALLESELVIEPRRQQALRVPVKQVKAIRFRAANTATDPKWLGIVAKESRGDTLVIRRGDNRLDPQYGIVEGIADGKVMFDLDGDKVKAPIEKLEGIVFGAARASVQDANVRVTDVYGSEWLVDSILPSQGDQPLTMRISDSLSHPLPLEQIKSIRWSGGLVLLAQQEPASNTTKPFFQTKLDSSLVEKFFAPKAIAGEDLIASGGSSIEYRIDPGYETFAGTVHRLDSVRNGSSLKVLIRLDGQTVWEQELVDAEPRGFELPLGSARRLAMMIDNGNDGDLGDTVRIVRPRFTK
jgi:hypothetical protein